MDREFSLVYLTAADSRPPEMIYQAARAGFEFVSLRTISMGLPGELDCGFSHNQRLLSDTKRALTDTGVRLLDIENARIHDGVNLSKYRAEMEVAAELGARAVLTNVWSKDRSFCVDQFSRLCMEAKSFGLWVNLEFVSWASVTNISEALELIEKSGADNTGIVVDALHFSRSRCTVEELAAVPPRFLTALHLCDAPGLIPTTVEGLMHVGRAERLYVGEGEIDLGGIVRHMPLSVVIGIEIPNIERAKVLGSSEHIFRCLETAKRFIRSLEGVAGNHEQLQAVDAVQNAV